MRACIATFLVLTTAAIPLVAQEDLECEAQESLWTLTIPSLAIEEQTVEKALEQIIEAFHKQYPDDKRLKGYSILKDTRRESINEPLRHQVVTMRGNDIALATALQIVASSLRYTVTIRDGWVVMAADNKGEDTLLIKMTSLIEKGLGKPLTTEGIWGFVKEIGFGKGDFRTIEIKESKDGKRRFIFLQGGTDAIRQVTAAFEFLDQGVVLRRLDK